MASRLQHDVRRVDGSGRLSLGKDKAGEQYDVTEQADGTLILIPVAVIPKRELWLHQNPQALADVVEGLKDSKEGRLKVAEDFSKYLADDEDD